MQLVLIAHHSLFDPFALSTGLTYAILFGALYGALRCAWDVLGLLARGVGLVERGLKQERSERESAAKTCK